MLNITATELKNRLGQYLDASLAEPVLIEKSGRATNVVLSRARYNELIEQEDKYWDLQAQLAEQEGFLTDDAVNKIVNRAS